MKNKIIDYNDLEKIRKKHQNIVFCSGCFDVLHSGHAYFFKQCKEFGDVLVVDVGSDKVIKSLKGLERPINSQNNRVYLISAFQDVDYAIIGGEEVIDGKIDFKEIMEKLKPDIFVLNDDDSAIEQKRRLCNELGVEMKMVSRVLPDFLKMISSTEIIKKGEKDVRNSWNLEL